MLNMILADAELELVPEPCWVHPAVVKDAHKRGKRPSRILLDASIHHQAMRILPDYSRRGRPDIAHFFLLLCLDSKLNRRGLLRTFVHTRNNEVLFVSPKTNLPKNYNRFAGLIESVYNNTVVPSTEDPLLFIRRNMTLKQLLERLDSKEIIAFSQSGQLSDLYTLFKSLPSEKNGGPLETEGTGGVVIEGAICHKEAEIAPETEQSESKKKKKGRKKKEKPHEKKISSSEKASGFKDFGDTLANSIEPAVSADSGSIAGYVLNKKLAEMNISCIIGGFPEGDFISPVYELATKKISIFPEMLKVWAVTSEVIVSYDRAVAEVASSDNYKEEKA
ncbi:MAG: hypothetical protein QW728_06280 [Thermoplasmata archaeon]